MGARNIYRSDEAYSRLSAQKREDESFTDVINRLARRHSILELRGLLLKREGRLLSSEIRKIRVQNPRRITASTKRMREATAHS